MDEIWNIFDELAKKIVPPIITNAGNSNATLEQLSKNKRDVVPIAKYKDLIKWFREQPCDMQRGAILRKKARNGNIAIIQVFLNKENEPALDENGKIFGRKMIVQSLDDELIEVFGRHNTIKVD